MGVTSGMNQMKASWRRDGAIWRSVGIFHAQLSGLLNVPRVTPAAIIAPAYQDYPTLVFKGGEWPQDIITSLNKPFITDVWLGYTSSAMSIEAPPIANGIPRPRMKREARNMPMSFESVWMITPIAIMTDPRVIECFLPSLSLVHDTKGMEITAPRPKAADMIPRIAP